jgi:hypothetical protein
MISPVMKQHLLRLEAGIGSGNVKSEDVRNEGPEVRCTVLILEKSGTISRIHRTFASYEVTSGPGRQRHECGVQLEKLLEMSRRRADLPEFLLAVAVRLAYQRSRKGPRSHRSRWPMSRLIFSMINRPLV